MYFEPKLLNNSHAEQREKHILKNINESNGVGCYKKSPGREEVQKLQTGCLTTGHSGARKSCLGPLGREKLVSWDKMAQAKESVCTGVGAGGEVHRCGGCSTQVWGAVHRCGEGVLRYRGAAGQGGLEMEGS